MKSPKLKTRSTQTPTLQPKVIIKRVVVTEKSCQFKSSKIDENYTDSELSEEEGKLLYITSALVYF